MKVAPTSRQGDRGFLYSEHKSLQRTVTRVAKIDPAKSVRFSAKYQAATLSTTTIAALQKLEHGRLAHSPMDFLLENTGETPETPVLQ